MSKVKPFITIKFAQSLDGRIASKTGDSKWISGIEARKFAHKLRSEHDAILVGVNTVIKDNPKLTTRLVKGKDPLRIIIDPSLKIPSKSYVVSSNTLIITSKNVLKTKKKKIDLLKKKGVGIVGISQSSSGRFKVKVILDVLKQTSVKKLLVEGGSNVITSFIKEGCFDEIIIILSPKIIGEGISSVGDLGISKISKAYKLNIKSVVKSGKDIVLKCKMQNEK